MGLMREGFGGRLGVAAAGLRGGGRGFFRRVVRGFPGGGGRFVDGERDDAGGVYVTVAVRNAADPERVWVGEFLAGTGAVDTVAPRGCLEAIGILPRAQRTFGLADGSEVRMDIAGGQLEFWGEWTYGTVVFGAEGVTPLLGLTALSSVGVEVDLRDGTVKKLPAVYWRGWAPRLG